MDVCVCGGTDRPLDTRVQLLTDTFDAAKDESAIPAPWFAALPISLEVVTSSVASLTSAPPPIRVIWPSWWPFRTKSEPVMSRRVLTFVNPAIRRPTTCHGTAQMRYDVLLAVFARTATPAPDSAAFSAKGARQGERGRFRARRGRGERLPSMELSCMESPASVVTLWRATRQLAE